MTTGWGSAGFQTTSEIVDLTVKGGNKCNNWPNFPFDVKGATGGLIGDTVIICGGYRGGSEVGDTSDSDECYSLTSEKVTLVTHMSVGRYQATSIVLNDNTLWITGGSNDGLLASTEYVRMTGTMPGPDMPMALYDHAMVAINSTYSMVIGGWSNGYSASTFFYDHNEGEWTTGPSLMQGRDGHAAGIITDEVTDENFVAVTGGSYYSNGFVYLDSTEILQDGNWVQGNINDAIICYLFGKLTVSK